MQDTHNGTGLVDFDFFDLLRICSYCCLWICNRLYSQSVYFDLLIIIIPILYHANASFSVGFSFMACASPRNLH